MTAEALIQLMTTHLLALCEAGDIAGTDALVALLAEMPQDVRDAVEAATC